MAAPDDATRRRFVANLSAAHTGHGTWEPGWTVVGDPEDDRLAVRRGELTFHALREQVRTTEDDAGAGLAPGTRCRVWIGKELRDLLPGFYLALGDTDEPEPRDGAKGDDSREDEADSKGRSVLRIYWHLTAEGAAPFVGALTTRLNGADVPFRCKVLDHPTAYRRADAGVLYLDPHMGEHRWQAVWEPLEEIYRQVAGHLRPEVPRCTRKLAPGVGVAEDPGNGLSFGQHRCRLVAQALWRAFDEGAEGLEERAEVLAAVFREEGLDPKRPHLGPGSQAEYPVFRIEERRSEPASLRVSPGSDQSSSRSPFSPLDAAAQIGDALCRTAYRHDGRCNWVGRSQNEVPQAGAPLVPTVAALGPTLYDGTAGVGLFLAHLHRATGEERHRTTALEALRQALGRVESSRETGVAEPWKTRRLGLYTGELGVLWAAWQVGKALGETELEETAERRLVKIARTLDEGAPEHDLDVIDGSAGAIPVFLTLYLETGREELLQGAVRLGEELCATALEREVGRAWDPHRANRRASREPGSRPWTGLSHGASGMALALYELHAVTGKQVLLDTALAAFAWEDHLFDPERCNWLDTRYPDTPTWGTAWCHGAPGIALTRLRAALLDPERHEVHLEPARAGLATTGRTLETARTAPGSDTSLCHGVGGLAEVLLLASRDLTDLDPEVDGDLDPTQLEALARETLEDLFERYGAEGPWPSGTPSLGPNPSLMLGTAGIGYTLLRLHDPEAVPSVLRVPTQPSAGVSHRLVQRVSR